MAKIKDRTGEKYNRLTFTKFVKMVNGFAYWEARCDCGRKKVVRASDVITGRTKACGCLQKETRIKNGHNQMIDMRKINTWWWEIDFSIPPRTSNNSLAYWALCTFCGVTEKWVSGNSIRSGSSKTCGCLREMYKTGSKTSSYNPDACRIIDEYGSQNGYSFRHAMNGGEVRILKYFVDGYDVAKNVVIEIDEPQHYKNGELRKKDIRRQRRIMRKLGCTFIRIRIDRAGSIICEPKIYKPDELPDVYPNYGILAMV